jgi:hypothetical protein
MGEGIICFSLGLSEEDIEKGKTSFYSVKKEATRLEVIAITKSMLDAQVGEILDSMNGMSEINDAGKRRNEKGELSADEFKYRVVVVHTAERELVLQVMRSFKAVLPEPQNIIFAVITDTARTWKFGEYIGHLAEEHEYMKKR